jgi:hypothetical protein
METLYCLIACLRSLFRDRRELALENSALRQQLAILARTQPHRHLRKTDRLFWVWLSRMWESWQESLIVVKPDTGVRWYRKGFALYRRRLSRQNDTGRPTIGKEIRKLIRKMAGANPLWGSSRVYGELLKLGIHILERTASMTVVPCRVCRTWGIRSTDRAVYGFDKDDGEVLVDRFRDVSSVTVVQTDGGVIVCGS